MAHMVWGDGGFLAAIGSVDFAGGNVVHISSGVSALVLPFILDRDEAMQKQPIAHTISHLYFSEQLCCGSDGSALMQEVR